MFRQIAGSLWAILLVAQIGQAAIAGAKPSTSTTHHKADSMAPDQRLFKQVVLNSREPNPCSPSDPGPAWRGILIQAPVRVELVRQQKINDAVIPVCGIYTLDMARLTDGKPMKLLVKNQKTGRVYQGEIVDSDPSPEAPPPAASVFDAESLKGMASSSYFNPNLAQYVQLPSEPAAYQVVVEYGGMRSNAVTIKVVNAP